MLKEISHQTELVDEERPDEGADKTIEIHVNEQLVRVTGVHQTGRSVKEAAIRDGVAIDLDFILSIERGKGQTKIIGDDDKVNVNSKSRFVAIPDDDNS